MTERSKQNSIFGFPQFSINFPPNRTACLLPDFQNSLLISRHIEQHAAKQEKQNPQAGQLREKEVGSQQYQTARPAIILSYKYIG